MNLDPPRSPALQVALRELLARERWLLNVRSLSGCSAAEADAVMASIDRAAAALPGNEAPTLRDRLRRRLLEGLTLPQAVAAVL